MIHKELKLVRDRIMILFIENTHFTLNVNKKDARWSRSRDIKSLQRLWKKKK